MSSTGVAFKKFYKFNYVDKDLVVFSIPEPMYRRHFGHLGGYNRFAVAAQHVKTADRSTSYELYGVVWYKFFQRGTIYSDRDSDEYLRARPSSAAPYKRPILYFVANLLDTFADIDNDFVYSNRKSFISAKRLKIYRKIK
ncbi:ORF73 [Spodoptera eridania nucleopolyhedrovirus]|uniref:ORF73 n=1 Tax=Spodoptera eridania nucleopolyhedrovirus TaxID=2315721 RepID=A0A346TQ11_9ABAC|nr:ORF73 [Spodoptera eridania nucleopolyhedrovirus]AXU41671.1 ORF73 [Spodoptera eridania nucleopolyhedrovirus]